jgi:SAM-dependent methyltransferase
MSLIKKILDFWTLSEVKNIEIDSAHTITLHKNIITSKRLLKYVYDSWYKEFTPAALSTQSIALPMIELGSGPSYMNCFIPDIIKTDVIAHPNIHQVIQAETLPYQDKGLRAIFLVNVLHHMQDPSRFFQEATRTLQHGGRLVMLEPSGSPINKWIFNRFHRSEYWDDTIKTWENKNQERLSSANNAIPSIVFLRDRKKFEADFPQLKIKKIKYHTLLSNILSGGLSYRSFLPGFCLPLVQIIETLAFPLMSKFGTMMTIDIEKIE